MYVFVLDKNLKPLDPCHAARARELLKKGRAKVYRRYPFTIALQDRTVEKSVTHPHRLKIDPGSRTSSSGRKFGQGINDEINLTTHALPASDNHPE